jgi:rsbT co-antagonist protein RsbR
MGEKDEPVAVAQEELVALRRRVAELEATLVELEAANRDLEVSEQQFRDLATYLPIGVYRSNAQGACTYVNPSWMAICGFTYEEAMGDGWTQALHPDDRDRVFAEWTQAADEGREFASEYRFLRPDKRVVWISVTARAFHDASGELVGHFGTVLDITQRKQSEQLTLENIRQQELIRAQESMLLELSTPIIPINDEIVVMPLIGLMDSRRAQQVMEILLAGISGRGARIAILDVTGVSTVDARVVSALLQAAQAVQLLGAETVICGIRPEMAQAIVASGLELGRIVTCGTLQTAIAYAMRDAQRNPGRSPRATPR